VTPRARGVLLYLMPCDSMRHHTYRIEYE
jgi:hypothetical protein